MGARPYQKIAGNGSKKGPRLPIRVLGPEQRLVEGQSLFRRAKGRTVICPEGVAVGDVEVAGPTRAVEAAPKTIQRQIGRSPYLDLGLDLGLDPGTGIAR